MGKTENFLCVLWKMWKIPKCDKMCNIKNICYNNICLKVIGERHFLCTSQAQRQKITFREFWIFLPQNPPKIIYIYIPQMQPPWSWALGEKMRPGKVEIWGGHIRVWTHSSSWQKESRDFCMNQPPGSGWVGGHRWGGRSRLQVKNWYFPKDIKYPVTWIFDRLHQGWYCPRFIKKSIIFGQIADDALTRNPFAPLQTEASWHFNQNTPPRRGESSNLSLLRPLRILTKC